MRRSTTKTTKTNERLFSSKRVFLLLFFIFIFLVVIRFRAINGLDTSSKDTYLYQFNGDVYADFYIENNKTIYKTKNSSKILHPYSFVELDIDDKSAIYQLLPDKKEHTLSLFTRPKWFEIIGGNYKSRDGDSIIRLNKKDEPSLIIFNADKKRSLLDAKELKIIALKSGYHYHSMDNRRVEIPVYGGSLSKIRSGEVWNRLHENGILLDSGYITGGSDIIKIYIGNKNKSVLASKKPKRYNLVKSKTINISIVDKNTPSSKFKLVYADEGFYETRLSYDFVRIAHLLIKFGVSNAEETIFKYVNRDNFLQKELLDLVPDFSSLKDENFYREYIKRRAELSTEKKKSLNLELLKYVSDGDYYRTKIAILLGANVNILNQQKKNLLAITLANQKRYLSIPKEMDFKDNKLTIRGAKNIFKNETYTKGAYFPSKVPIFDKPRIPKEEYLNVDELNEFVDVTHLNGIYISDENAKVSYSKTATNFLQEAETDYRKSPPLFLYDDQIKGKFVAPVTNIKGRFYYKIETKKRQIKVAFNGIIRQNGKIINKNYNQIVPFFDPITINVKGGSTILEVSFDGDFLPCGVIFKSKKEIKNFRYSYDGKHYRKFEVVSRGDNFYYRLQRDSSKPFNLYQLKVKADAKGSVIYLGNSKGLVVGKKAKGVGYSPSLTCLAKDYGKDRLSFYDDDNMMELIPKSYREDAMIPKDRAKIITGEDIKEREPNSAILYKKLLPIYGDGLHFGLTAKGVEAKELTLDADFSKEVADIFESVIEPLKTNQEIKKRKKYNTILEGAVVVLADRGKDNLEVVSMFSYPYPKKLDIGMKEEYKREIFRYMLVDEFNNPKSSLRNRALDMRIRPGSTFKIVTSIAGFKYNLIPQLDSKYRIFIEGRPDIYGTIFRGKSKIDMRLKNFSFSNGFTEKTDDATFRSSFKKSYNVYFGYLALLMNHKLDRGFVKSLFPISNDIKDREDNFALLKIADSLGFNKKIELSKEKNIFASASIFPQQFVLSKEVADSAIGQFEVASTPMQMAIVANTIRSRDVVTPKIIKEEKSQTIHKNFITPSTQRAIEEAMRDVVMDRDGTAKCAFYHNSFASQAQAYNRKVPKERAIKVPCMSYKYKFRRVNPKDFAFSDVKVYGKTGTAEKGKGGLYDGWFVSFTKSKKRGDIVVATVVRNSGTGGTYSATITKKVIEAWYRLQEKRSREKK